MARTSVQTIPCMTIRNRLRGYPIIGSYPAPKPQVATHYTELLNPFEDRAHVLLMQECCNQK